MRVRYDAVTRLAYAQLALVGWILYSFGPTVPLLREEQGVGRGLSAVHGTMFAVAAVGVGLGQARVVGRIGRGGLLRWGVGLLVVGVLLYTATTWLPLTLLGAFVVGLGNSILVNGTTAVLTEHQGAAGPAAVTEANAAAAASGVISPLAVGAAVALGLTWRPAVLLMVPFGLALLWATWRVRYPEPHPLPAVAEDDAPRRLPHRYWLAFGALVCIIGVEFCVTIWAADLIREQTGVSAGAGAAAVAGFVAGILAGRLGGGRVALRVDPTRLLLASLVLCGAGFAVLWTATSYPIAVLGMLVTGLGCSLQFPLGATRAVHVAGGLTDLATGRNSIAAGLAAGGFPFLLGALADAVGVRAAFLVVPGLLAVAAVAVIATAHATDPGSAPGSFPPQARTPGP